MPLPRMAGAANRKSSATSHLQCEKPIQPLRAKALGDYEVHNRSLVALRR
jgi:hypothetical protein